MHREIYVPPTEEIVSCPAEWDNFPRTVIAEVPNKSSLLWLDEIYHANARTREAYTHAYTHSYIHIHSSEIRNSRAPHPHQYKFDSDTRGERNPAARELSRARAADAIAAPFPTRKSIELCARNVT